jgi:SSS family solute:Na+ symporter
VNLHLLVVIVYSVALVALGLFIGRRVKTSGAFFVAGRALSPLLLFATLLAANIGAGSTVNASALGHGFGLSAWWWVGSAGIGTLLLAFWIGPRMWRVATERELRTVGDYLELRYGGGVRAAVAVLLWVGTLFILAAQLLAVSVVLQAIADVPKGVGLLIGGAVMTAYFTAGGLLSSAWVNLVQLVVLFAGFLIAVPFALSSVAGWEGLMAASSVNTEPSFFDLWRRGDPAIRFLALLVPAFVVSPGLLQKVYGARSERAVRLGVGWAAVALLGFAFLPAILGMVARAHYPELSGNDLALPLLLAEKLPLLIGSLGLAAIFSAEVSSADAILFMLATSLSRDLYHRFVRPEATDASVLRVARVAAIVGGGLGILLAYAFETILAALTIFYSVMSVSLFVPVVLGLQMKTAGRPEAIASIMTGVPVLVAVHFATDGAGYGSIFNPTLLGLLASAGAFVTVWLLRDRNRRVDEKRH